MYPYQRRAPPAARLILIAAVAGAGLLGAVLLGLPRLAATAPQGAQVSARASISLTFTADMDPASVESRLHIAPAVVGAFSWQDRTLRFVPAAEWPAGPVRVELDAGASARNSLPMLFGSAWEFTVGAPGIAYLQRTGDAANIFSLPVWGGGAAGAGEPVQVSRERFGVDRFTLSPDGAQFIYAALRDDGGADLKRLDRGGGDPALVLDCGGDRCTAPALSRDGRRLAFERHPRAHLEQSIVEVLDLGTGERTALAADPAHLSQAPVFARDGRLAFLDPTGQVIVVHDFASQTTRRIPNASGEMAAWSPDGQYLVFPEITSEPPPPPGPGTPAPALQLDTFFSHLTRVTTGAGVVQNLSGLGAVEDAGAVYSPSGEWIVFGRKNIEQEKWTPGRQMWLMRADGSAPRALTGDPLFNHSGFVWGPDGSLIVYVRFDVTDAASITEIWSMSADGTGARKLVTGGYLPVWLP